MLCPHSVQVRSPTQLHQGLGVQEILEIWGSLERVGSGQAPRWGKLLH